MQRTEAALVIIIVGTIILFLGLILVSSTPATSHLRGLVAALSPAGAVIGLFGLYRLAEAIAFRRKQ